mmetsp:Transcript_6530/g.7469  ORF Transcript_6530/g.7469 Transcript_6530/m.7469 type:complete len:89 (+) Transcript_6530:1336-1602(+)
MFNLGFVAMKQNEVLQTRTHTFWLQAWKFYNHVYYLLYQFSFLTKVKYRIKYNLTVRMMTNRSTTINLYTLKPYTIGKKENHLMFAKA